MLCFNRSIWYKQEKSFKKYSHIFKMNISSGGKGCVPFEFLSSSFHTKQLLKFCPFGNMKPYQKMRGIYYFLNLVPCYSNRTFCGIVHWRNGCLEAS